MEERPDSALSVLERVKSESLNTKRTRAKFSLLYTIALDKNYVDTADVFVIMPALDYYGRFGSAYDKMRSKFYYGVILYNGRDFNNAVIPLAEAENLAAEIGDSLFLGRILSLQGAVFAAEHNSYEEVKVALKEVQCLKNADKRSAALAMYNLGVAYNNIADYASAITCFDEAIEMFTNNKDTVRLAMATKAKSSTLVLKPDSEPHQSIKLFSYAISDLNSKLSKSEMASLALAYSSTGQKEKSDSIVSKIGKAKVSLSTLSRIQYHNKDYKTAYEMLYGSLKESNEQERKALSNSTIVSLNEHWKNTLQMTEQRMMISRLLLLCSILIIIVIAFAAFLIWSRLQNKNNELTEKIIAIGEQAEQNEQELLAAQSTINAQEAQLENLQIQINANKESTRKKGARTIHPFVFLCRKYLEAGSDTKTQEQVLNDIVTFVKDFKSKKSKEVEKVINDDLDNVMLKLRQDMKNFTEMDFRIVTYMLLGFDTNMMCILTQCTKKQIYTSTYRLRNRILKKESLHHSLYETIFGRL